MVDARGGVSIFQRIGDKLRSPTHETRLVTEQVGLSQVCNATARPPIAPFLECCLRMKGEKWEWMFVHLSIRPEAVGQARSHGNKGCGSNGRDAGFF